MSVLVWAERETEDFASLLGRYAVIDSGLLNECIGMGRTGDARFCVSTGLVPLMEMGNMYAIESLLWCVSMCG